MEKFNREGIKSLIRKHPKIGRVLMDDYSINCMKCKGNCCLKNVAEEEDLSLEDEMKLMGKINDIIESCDS